MKKALIFLVAIVMCLMPVLSGCDLLSGKGVKFTLEYKDESTECVLTMNTDLTFTLTLKNYMQPYCYGSFEYSGTCIEKAGNYYMSGFDSAFVKSYAFGYNLCDINYDYQIKSGNYRTISYVSEDSFVTNLGQKLLLLKNPRKKYAINEAVAVVSNNFDSETQGINILQGTANDKLKEEMGLYVVYGGGNYDADGISKIEGIDTGHTGSYTATVTYGNNKTITLPVNVVDDYVINWPYIRYNWLVGSQLADVINDHLYFTTKTEGQVTVTEDMITGWDSETEGEKTVEFKYNDFSKEYKVNFCTDYQINGIESIAVNNDNDKNNLSGFVPIEKGNDWQRERVRLSYSYSDNVIREVSLDDEEIEVIGFDTNKVGFQYLDIKYKGNTSKILFYVYDNDNKPVIDTLYYKYLGGYLSTKRVIYCSVPTADITGLYCMDVYIDGSRSQEKEVPTSKLPGFDYQSIRKVDYTISEVAEQSVRAGNLDNIYTISDSFTVGGATYNGKAYVAYYNSAQ